MRLGFHIGSIGFQCGVYIYNALDSPITTASFVVQFSKVLIDCIRSSHLPTRASALCAAIPCWCGAVEHDVVLGTNYKVLDLSPTLEVQNSSVGLQGFKAMDSPTTRLACVLFSLLSRFLSIDFYKINFDSLNVTEICVQFNLSHKF